MVSRIAGQDRGQLGRAARARAPRGLGGVQAPLRGLGDVVGGHDQDAMTHRAVKKGEVARRK